MRLDDNAIGYRGALAWAQAMAPGCTLAHMDEDAPSVDGGSESGQSRPPLRLVLSLRLLSSSRAESAVCPARPTRLLDFASSLRRRGGLGRGRLWLGRGKDGWSADEGGWSEDGWSADDPSLRSPPLPT